MECFKFLKNIAMLAIIAISAAAQQQTTNWQLVPEKEKYPKTEAVVAGFIADAAYYGKGAVDATAYLQELLDKLDTCSGEPEYAGGGGVLYLPEGKYKIDRQLRIPKGVTIRGDWKKPVKGQPIEGTILMAYYGRGQADDGSNAFITMRSASAIMDIAIWYPEQLPNEIVQYPNTIQFGGPNYFGNEFCNVKNVTLVNAYRGIVFYQGGGTCPTINGVYGSPLSLGVEIDRIVDIGRIEHCDFSPMYWIGSKLDNSPDSSNTAYKNYLYENATGVVMRRNDWSYTTYLTVEGYNKGFHAVQSLQSDGNGGYSTPNGHNYGFDIKNCKYGLYFESRASVGCMFTEVKIAGCEFGAYFSNDAGGVAQLYKWDLSATKCAIYCDPQAQTKITMQESVIKAGKVLLQGATFMAVDNDFNNPQPQIEFEANSRGNIVGNRSDKSWQILQKSAFENLINHDGISGIARLPQKKIFAALTKKPAGKAFKVVTDAPYNAPKGIKTNFPNNGSAPTVADATAAIQSALNDVSGAGGGIVYLAPGHYRIDGQINIPSNVELKGGIDVSAFPMGPGSVLEIYNKDSVAVVMNQNSGLRGVVFNHPEQVICNVMPDGVIDFPFTIQGKGSNIYIVNVGMRSANKGVDLFTSRCDNFYIDFLTGYFFREGVNIKNSANGILANMQCNTIVYNCGDETKFGKFPNSERRMCGANGTDNLPEEKSPYLYNSKNLNFLTLENVKDIFMYNDFNYNTLNGIVVKDSVTGLALGFALDDDRTGILLDGSGINLDFINLQNVALQRGNPSDGLSSYIKSTSNYAEQSVVNIFSSDYWGYAGQSGVVMNGAGTVNLYSANFEHSGVGSFANVNAGKLNVIASVINPPNGNNPTYNGSAAGNISTTGSMTKGDASVAGNTNIGQSAVASTSGSLNDCNIWTASATYTYEGSAQNIVDCNTENYWNSGWQNQGQGKGAVSITVDMKSSKTFNQVLLSYGNRKDDGPESYILQVSNDQNTWTDAASGSGRNNSITIISFSTQTARYIRITKPASNTGNYWGIDNFYVMNITLTNLADIPVVPDGTPAIGEDGGSWIRKKAADKKYGILLENAVVSQYAKIEVRTPDKHTHVNIVIYDNVGNIVFEASERSDTFIWNLTNKAGRIVANGSYLIAAETKANGVNAKQYFYTARIGVKR